MLFALIHEIAHMITGIVLKLRPRMLKIEPFGIGIIFEGFKNTEKNKILIASILFYPNTNKYHFTKYYVCFNYESKTNYTPM